MENSNTFPDTLLVKSDLFYATPVDQRQYTHTHAQDVVSNIYRKNAKRRLGF